MIERTDEAGGGPAAAVDEGILLRLLAMIEQSAEQTQRTMSHSLDIALGLANSYIRRCVRKGLVKVQQSPPNRYLYYLTPEGFREKGRLTVAYLARSFNFYREARSQYMDVFAACERAGWRRIVLCGAGDLAEIAAVAAMGAPVQLIGLLDGQRLDGNAGLRVVRELSELGDVDVLVVTDITNPQGTIDYLSSIFPAERVLAPSMFNITIGPSPMAE